MAAYTQSDLDALRSSIARGVRVVEYNGERVEYRSLKEMQSLASQMERELSGQASTRSVFGTSNGMR